MFTTLFPADCRLCGEPLIEISRLQVCHPCLQAIHPIATLICAICGERLGSSYTISPNDGIARCGQCEQQNPPFAKAVAYGSYDGGLRELIHLLKYNQVKPAANVLGRMLADAISNIVSDFDEEPPLLVPVPLYPSKLRQRGFNQSELVARAALKNGLRRLSVNTSAVERKRVTQSQTGLTRHQRLENMRGAFSVVHPAEVAERDILLVDDVFTTGTTVSECARILRRAGANRIWVATVARVLRPEPVFAVDESWEEAEAVPRAMAAHV